MTRAPTGNALRVMHKACAAHGTVASIIFARASGRGDKYRRTREFIDLRAKVWAEMRRAGLSWPEIGDATGTAHSTVIEGAGRVSERSGK